MLLARATTQGGQVGRAPAYQAQGRGSPPHPFVAAGDESALMAGLEPSDRAAYEQAVRLLADDDMDGAWSSLEPLLRRYSDSYAVQHLACALSMQLGLATYAQSACPRVQELRAAAQ